jgi:hypothetical protein
VFASQFAAADCRSDSSPRIHNDAVSLDTIDCNARVRFLLYLWR